jgi:hypothetical protein
MTTVVYYDDKPCEPEPRLVAIYDQIDEILSGVPMQEAVGVLMALVNNGIERMPDPDEWWSFVLARCLFAMRNLPE